MEYIYFKKDHIYLLVIVLLVSVLIVWKVFPMVKERFTVSESRPAPVPPPQTKRIYRGGSSKCFSCEAQTSQPYPQGNGVFPNSSGQDYTKYQQTLGHSSKCFSCERHANMLSTM